MDPRSAELIIEQVERPVNGWCDSGHRWPEGSTWKKLPDQGPELLVFFYVKTKDRQATICEPCLVLVQNIVAAQRLAREKGLL